MSVSTQGLALNTSSRGLRRTVELLSSMRFSISLLTVICIASVIGTVLKQQEPYGNYVNQFGPFWAEVFGDLHLYAVYSAWWFLLILAFLVVSTSLCVARNTPKILADLKAYKEDLREQSLRSFGHYAQADLSETPQRAAERVQRVMSGLGWKLRSQTRSISGGGEGIMLAAKAGSANKLGYLAAHSAIVLICLGGLLDGDLVVRAQMWFNGKTPYTGGGLISDVPAQHRLSDTNPTFRGNLMVAEGAQSHVAILTQSDGVVLQELPFTLELKKFVVEHYSTGMPKLFASDIVIHDRETGAAIPERVEVNHPARYKGVEIYQSSFDDGGSRVRLRSVPMHDGAAAPLNVEGVIGGSTSLVNGRERLSLEFTALRVMNVENVSGAAGSGVDPRKVDLRAALDARLGAGNKVTDKKTLRNVGPSIGYKLRDAAGQARESQNYMLPVDTGDGVPVFLMGARENPDEPFRYLRVPADERGSMDTFFRLRDALADAGARSLAVRRYAARAVDPAKPELGRQLTASADKALALFAGAEPTAKGSGPRGGLQAVSDFLEANVPQADRERAGEVLVRILNGVLFELAQIARERAAMPALAPGDQTQAFMTQAVLSLGDLFLYPAPMALELTGFDQVQASVFQVARAPGKNVVYLGCALLILGVFAMLYIRERRLWVWLTPAPGQSGAAACSLQMAWSSNRKTLDGEREFADLKRRLIGEQHE